jgi:hypothetical protein
VSAQVDVRKQQEELAYQLWVERGRPEGRPEEDWFEAERRLRSDQHENNSAAVDEAARESFPASDPPSPHLPDKPPINAKRRKATAPRRPPGIV